MTILEVLLPNQPSNCDYFSGAAAFLSGHNGAEALLTNQCHSPQILHPREAGGGRVCGHLPTQRGHSIPWFRYVWCVASLTFLSSAQFVLWYLQAFACMKACVKLDNDHCLLGHRAICSWKSNFGFYRPCKQGLYGVSSPARYIWCIITSKVYMVCHHKQSIYGVSSQARYLWCFIISKVFMVCHHNFFPQLILCFFMAAFFFFFLLTWRLMWIYWWLLFAWPPSYLW